MIISASYKTDIPAFYGTWLMNRLRAGSCKMVNPYGRQMYEIDLRPEAVDGIVFWTKNIGPLLRRLPEVRDRGYTFVVQHSITGYPRELEERVVAWRRAADHLHAIAQTYGPEVAIWRYDPILLTSLTPLDWHSENFARIAARLEGATNEVVISFAQVYQKTRRNLEAAAREHGFTWEAHERLMDGAEGDGDVAARALLARLAAIARAHGMRLSICSQPRFLVPGVAAEAHCVEAARLERVARAAGKAGKPIAASRQQGNRKECACSAARDIGEYDTCPHGCVYCYAVRNRPLALARFKAHDPEGEFLFPPRGPLTEATDASGPPLMPMAAITRRGAMPTMATAPLWDQPEQRA